MTDEFRPYFGRPDEPARQRAWTEGLVVLDTGALLGLYRYPKRTSDDLVEVYEAVGDRLWVPHQAAVEFYRNRESVIAGQEAVFDAAQSAVENAVATLKASLEEMAQKKQIRDRHSLLDLEDLVDPFDEAAQSVMRVIGQKRGARLTALGTDPVREAIEGFVGGRVTRKPTQEELDAIYDEGESRFEVQRPPGYMDLKDKRGKRFSFRGLTFKREYGDLVVWKQALALAKDEGAVSLIFVTDDQKEDWWARPGGQTLGPRQELVEEAYDIGVETLLFYTPQGVLEVGAGYLDVDVGLGSAEGAAPPPPRLPSERSSLGAEWTAPRPSIPLVELPPEMSEAFRRYAEALTAFTPVGAQLRDVATAHLAGLPRPSGGAGEADAAGGEPADSRGDE